jgi:hypothetical protein
MRYQKHSTKFERLVHQAEVDVVNAYNKSTTERYLKPTVIKDGLATLLEPDMDKTSAEDALDSQQAYYKVWKPTAHPSRSIETPSRIH